MKKIITLAFVTLISITGFSQANIAAARALGVGATVTITGVITNGDELGPIRYIEDATAAMALYDPTVLAGTCLLYTSPSPRDKRQSRMPAWA